MTKHPDTGRDLCKELVVPMWEEHLLIASRSYEMTELGYFGADIVLDKNKGPMLQELNARPGLAIQIANGRGMADILKKIEKSYPKNLTPEERVDYVLQNAGK